VAFSNPLPGLKKPGLPTSPAGQVVIQAPRCEALNDSTRVASVAAGMNFDEAALAMAERAVLRTSHVKLLLRIRVQHWIRVHQEGIAEGDEARTADRHVLDRDFRIMA